MEKLQPQDTGLIFTAANQVPIRIVQAKHYNENSGLWPCKNVELPKKSQILFSLFSLAVKNEGMETSFAFTGKSRLSLVERGKINTDGANLVFTSTLYPPPPKKNKKKKQKTWGGFRLVLPL